MGTLKSGSLPSRRDLFSFFTVTKTVLTRKESDRSTVGDWFPERNLFQLLIALTSGPRFLLVLVTYVAHRQLRPASRLPGTLAIVGILRALMCGGWVFVTSTDHGAVHDVCMVS